MLIAETFALLEATMIENYHTHTPRCRHASGTEEEYVQQAIAGGLQVLGFSDHTPFIFPGTYYSTMRMFPEEIYEYAATIDALKEKYADKIQIRLGLEVEYYPDRMADLLKLIENVGIEYMILGHHWCGNEQGQPYNGRPTDDENRLRQYCTQAIEAMETGLFSYFAHPDLLYFTGDRQIYRTYMHKLCQASKTENIPLEINLLGLRTNRHYPNEIFWEIAGNVGCKVVLGSDAHSPSDVVDRQTEEKALRLVEKYHLQLLEHVPIHPYQWGKIAK